MGNVRPSDAVDLGEDGTGTAAHAAAEGVDPAEPRGMGSYRTLQEMALSTEPSVPLAHVESLWDPEHGGRRRITRGIQKALGADGIPAIVDIGLGVLEEVLTAEDASGNDPEGNEHGDDEAVQEAREELDGLAGV